MAQTLLIVEDDPRLAETLARSFTARGYEVRHAASVEAAREITADFTPARAIVDLKLAEGSGLDVVAHLAGLDPAPRIVETPAGMINAIGLQGIGVHRFRIELVE